MSDVATRRWQDADEAVESLVTVLSSLAARAEHRSSRKRPRGRALPKRGGKSTRRYLAEVIRSHRLAPGRRVDRNMIAALFTGHRELVGDPVLVVAVAQACGIIAGRTLTGKEAARLRAASERAARLIRRAQEAGPLALVPAPATPFEPGPPTGTPTGTPAGAAAGALAAAPAGEPVADRAEPVPVREGGPAPGTGTDAVRAAGVREADSGPDGARGYRPMVAAALLVLLAVLAVLGALLLR